MNLCDSVTRVQGGNKQDNKRLINCNLKKKYTHMNVSTGAKCQQSSTSECASNKCMFGTDWTQNRDSDNMCLFVCSYYQASPCTLS